MAISWPFDSTVSQDAEGNPIYSRAYSATVLARILAKYFRNGVFSDASTGLQVTAGTGLSVTVLPGDALINGHHFYEESETPLSLPAADGSLARIDTVVLRLNLTVSVLSIGLAVVSGTAASTPAAPALTRNASVWELGLANVLVSAGATEISQAKITDTRLDSARCGVVASIIGDTDTSAYYAQIAADLAGFKAVAETGFSSWSAEQRAAFDAWFAQAKGVLAGDAAGNLLNLINGHAPITFTISLPASGWSGSGPYTQTVTVAGMLATDTPLADVVLSDTADSAMAQLEAYALVGRIDTAADAVTVTCYDNAPAVDLTVRLKVVR